jgi:pimeloyl-ACP methyl ester carboxylesterase
MGAKASMVVALRSPQLIANLIPVDNAPVDAALKSDFGQYVKGMKKVEEARCKKQSEADAIFREYEEVSTCSVNFAGNRTDPRQSLPVRQFLLSNLVRPTPNDPLVFQFPLNTLSKALDKMADFPYKDPDVIRYNKPTLFVRGTKSHYVSDEVLPIIGRFFPKFELADVDSGHWVISERPTEFREAVVSWMEDKV